MVVVFGTVASNHDGGVPYPVGLGAALAGLALLPAALPRVLAPVGVRPPWPLAVSGALVGGYFAAAYADGPVFLVLPAVSFVMASAAQRWMTPALLAVGLMWIGMAWQAWRWDGPPYLVWQALGMLGLTMGAGAGASAIRSRLEARAARAERTATAERLRMAQELHDGVGHGLSVIAMQAGVALHVLEQDPAKARASLEAIRETSKESLTALRTELAAMAGDEAPRRPSPGTDELLPLIDRVRGAGLRVDVEGETGAVPTPVGEAVYVVVQEALTNVLRHADASRARVRFERRGDSDLLVSVTDDGRGGAADLPTDGGLGLSGMRSRVEGLGGTFHAAPDVDGFWVRAELPLTQEAR